MSRACLACGASTQIGASIDHPALRAPYVNEPFCGKPCALVRIGDDITDLAVAQRGFDAAAAEHATLLNTIEQREAELRAARQRAVNDRDQLGAFAAESRRQYDDRREKMQRNEDIVRAMSQELEGLRAAEQVTADRMEALARTMSKIQQRVARADRGEDEEMTRSARVRYSSSASTERESRLPFYAQFSRDRRDAPPEPRGGTLFQTWGDAELAATSRYPYMERGNPELAARAAAMEM